MSQIYCERCDGCGWYEGGKTLRTKCEECDGAGVVPCCEVCHRALGAGMDHVTTVDHVDLCRKCWREWTGDDD